MASIIRNNYKSIIATGTLATGLFCLTNTTNPAAEKINQIFMTTMLARYGYHFIETGLARLFALETLRHGTSLSNYIKINFNGADPSIGEETTGSSILVKDCVNTREARKFFHVFKDSEFCQCFVNSDREDLILKDFDYNKFFKAPFSNLYGFLKTNVSFGVVAFVQRKIHAVLSSTATLGYLKAKNTVEKVAISIIGAISGVLTPSLNFHFKPEELFKQQDPPRFENDPFYVKAAYRTRYPIPTIHLGITGAISQGIDSKTFKRMLARPYKVIEGIIRLAIGLKIYSYMYS